MKNRIKMNELKYINKPLLLMTIIYAIGGAFLILNASSISSILYYGQSSPYHFFIRQLLFIGASFVASLFIIKFPTKTYKGLSIIFIFVLLIMMLIQAGGSLIERGINEATISIFGTDFQFAEFIKVFLIMYMGAYYGVWANNEHNKYSFIWPLVLCAGAVIFIALKGDYGSAAVMIALFALIFISIPSKDKIIKIIRIMAISGLVLAIVFLKFGYLIISDESLNSSYRWNRFLYTSPCDRYEDSSGYQVCNGYIAIHNGGLTGVGIGNSVQKYLYLPASHTDFIFPIIVEEFGVITSVLIIIGYMYITFLIFKIASISYKLQNSITAYGIGIYFILHIFVNLGGVLGLIPLTGVPLPFLSYGGSFCMATICAFAVLQRIHIENVIEKKKLEIKTIVNK